MPKFSIIVVHYQGVNTHETFLRGIGSLQAQTFRDFEILCYHDGPLLDPNVQFPLPITCTQVRHDDWGHTLRDLGIRAARGDYLLHFNADNLLYPDALQEIVRELERPPRLRDAAGNVADTDHIVIFPVKMWGLTKFLDCTAQAKGDVDWYTILTGSPPEPYYIDCMQLVMRRELWLAEGGWYDRRAAGDGHMYRKFTRKYGYRSVRPVLGEHF